MCTQWRLREVKNSLGMYPVWLASSLYTQRVAKDPSFFHANSKDWSDQVDAQAELSLCWVHIPFVVHKYQNNPFIGTGFPKHIL